MAGKNADRLGMEIKMNETLQEALNVHYIKLSFTLVLTEDTVLPVHKVSALRGGMGEMLLRANCIRDRKCESCYFAPECMIQRTMYSQFEKKPRFVTTGESIGYVIECDNHRQEFAKGDTLMFHLILFGRTAVYFNLFLQAIHMLGMNGLGKHESSFQIANITNTDGEPVLDGLDVHMERYQVKQTRTYVEQRLKTLKGTVPAKMIFETPLTVKYNGDFLREFHMDAIIRSVKRRIYMLDCFEGIDGEEAFDHNYLLPVIRHQEVRRRAVRRYSTRKQSAMYLNGIQGEIELEQLEPETLGLLLAGELIHIGKNTSFGFGKYSMEC